MFTLLVDEDREYQIPGETEAQWETAERIICVAFSESGVTYRLEWVRPDGHVWTRDQWDCHPVHRTVRDVLGIEEPTA